MGANNVQAVRLSVSQRTSPEKAKRPGEQVSGFDLRTRYDPERAQSADAWLRLDEGFRHQLVEAYHRRQRIRFPNARVHAAFHVVVENQLALGEEAVLDTLARLCRDGLTRHDAIHAIASVLAGHVYDIATGRRPDPMADPSEVYFEQLEGLTAAGWREGG